MSTENTQDQSKRKLRDFDLMMEELTNSFNKFLSENQNNSLTKITEAIIEGIEETYKLYHKGNKMDIDDWKYWRRIRSFFWQHAVTLKFFKIDFEREIIPKVSKEKIWLA